MIIFTILRFISIFKLYKNLYSAVFRVKDVTMAFAIYYALIFGTVMLGVAVVMYLFKSILAAKVDHAGVQKIGASIRAGALTFLKEEYKLITIVALAVASILAFLKSWLVAGVYIVGALFSSLTGFLGMVAATQANVRTTLAAKKEGEQGAFLMAFFGGGVMGFAVATFGLFGLGLLFVLFNQHMNFVELLTAFGLGASSVAFFARVGGGIYTKSADVGADLVGKVEVGIPEDDPRNPAVIADNVGDCVGDTAGMGADIYESYIGAMVSSIILALSSVEYRDISYQVLPIILASLGLLSSVIGLFSSALFGTSPASMLRNATYIAIACYILFTAGYLFFAGMFLYLLIAICLGCLAGIMIGLVTEYYTGGGPVEQVAQSSESGAGTNLIYGLSVGMESVVIPVMLLVMTVILAYIYGGGLYGISLAAVSMLATVGITMTVDAYGPIADNAGGIAEMSNLGSHVRSITDKLDMLGNTTAAIGKGFAIGSALLTALALFNAYAEQAQLSTLNIIDPYVLAGVFVGGAIPFLISALTMRSVGNAALQMVVEVRRQFKEIAGLMEGTTQPDYERCIAISTRASLREMFLPGFITILAPVGVFYTLGKAAVGGLLVGATVVGVMLALMMANSGGVWDNAKKYIEAGHLGGKGSDAHKAAVVGDTVGDPFKDTSGPALNILIKLMSIVALLLVS